MIREAAKRLAKRLAPIDSLIRQRDALLRERDALPRERDDPLCERDALLRERAVLVGDLSAGKKPQLTVPTMDAIFQGLVTRGYFPQTVYDIGAAEGGWTRWALRYWPNARFVCFEPLEERR